MAPVFLCSRTLVAGVLIMGVGSSRVRIVNAQDSEQTPVRFTATDGTRFQGIVTRLSDDSVKLNTLDGGSISFARSDADKIEILTTGRGSTLAEVIGAVAGAAVGFALVYEDATAECNRNTWMGELCDLQWIAWMGVPAGLAVGGLAGWTVGLICCTRTKWQPASLEQVQAFDKSIAVGVSLRAP